MNVNEILVTNESKCNFLKGLIRLSKCDGIVDEREKMLFEQASVAMGISDTFILNEVWDQNEPIEIEFSSTREKMFFFVQAIQLCWIDENYDFKEKQEVRKMARQLDISVDAIVAVEKWVEEGMLWNKKGLTLLDLQ